MTAILFFSILVIVSAEDLLEDVSKAMEKEKYQTAIELYRQYLDEHPDEYSAKFGLGRALAFSGEYDKALETYNEILEDNSSNPDVLLSRGLVYSWTKQFEKAEKDLKQVIEQVPDYSDAWSALGNVYLWTEQYNKAQKTFSRWAELETENPAPILGRAKTLVRKGEYAQAQEQLRLAREKGASEEALEEISPIIQEKRRGDRNWEFTMGYAFNSLSDDFSAWHRYSTRLQRNFSKGSVALELFQAHQFSEKDEGIGFDGYLELWSRSYANLQFEVGNDIDFLPTTDTRFELFQGFGERWEISGNYRHMDFPNNNVDSYGFTLAKYLGSWYLRGGTNFTPEADDVLLSYSLMARYYFQEDSFIEVVGGLGEEIVTIGAGPVLDSRDTSFAGIRGEHFFTPWFGLYCGYEFFDIEKTWNRHGVTTGVMFRW